MNSAAMNKSRSDNTIVLLQQRPASAKINYTSIRSRTRSFSSRSNATSCRVPFPLRRLGYMWKGKRKPCKGVVARLISPQRPHPVKLVFESGDAGFDHISLFLGKFANPGVDQAKRAFSGSME